MAIAFDKDSGKCAIPWVEPEKSWSGNKKAISPERLKPINDADTKVEINAEFKEETKCDVEVKNSTATENRKVIEFDLNPLRYLFVIAYSLITFN